MTCIVTIIQGVKNIIQNTHRKKSSVARARVVEIRQGPKNLNDLYFWIFSTLKNLKCELYIIVVG